MGDRLAMVEEMMVRRNDPGTIERHVVRKYNVEPRQARRYMAMVREKWAAESLEAGDRDARRLHMRATLEHIVATAMTTTKSGPPPDVRAATRTAKLLMDLDGLMEAPPKATIQLEGTIGVAAATTTAPNREALEAWLRGKAPNPA